MAEQRRDRGQGQQQQRQSGGGQQNEQENELGLKEREYRDEDGNIHHHTREYLKADPEDKGRPLRSKQGGGEDGRESRSR